MGWPLSREPRAQEDEADDARQSVGGDEDGDLEGASGVWGDALEQIDGTGRDRQGEPERGQAGGMMRSRDADQFSRT